MVLEKTKKALEELEGKSELAKRMRTFLEDFEKAQKYVQPLENIFLSEKEQCEKLEENKKNATQDFKECVAVADYYKAAFYKNVYAVGKDSQKLSQMEQNMEDAQKRMGEMSPIKVKIDRMLEEYMVANN